MASNVRNWHGLTLGDNEVILRDTGEEAGRFRNRCHEFVRQHYPVVHRTCFPKSVGKSNYGGCAERGKWKRLLKDNFNFRRETDGTVYLTHLTDGKEAKVYGAGLD